MIRITMIALLGCVSLSLVNVSAVADLPLPKKVVQKEVDPKDNKERLLIFTPDGPIVLDVHLTQNDLPYRMVRKNLVDEILKQADTNGDGKSIWKEAVANRRFIIDFSRFKGGKFGKLKTYLKRLDRNQNNVMERSEANQILSGGSSFQCTAGTCSRAIPDIRERIDANADDIISKQELESMSKTLSNRDSDGNKLIDKNEISGSNNTQGVYDAQPAGISPSPIFHFTKSTISAKAQERFHVRLLENMQERYGDDDDVISEKKVKLLTSVWQNIDKNNNHLLDPNELQWLQSVQPHLVLHVTMGASKKVGVRLLSAVNEFKDVKLLKQNGLFKLTTPAIDLLFSLPPQTEQIHLADAKLQFFDTDRNGYIDEKEFKNNPRNRASTNIFKRWDANADGKVYVDEIVDDHSQSLKQHNSHITVMAKQQKQTFFPLLDDTGDERLNVREVKIAKTKLLTYDKNRDGQLSASEVPQEIILYFFKGNQMTTSVPPQPQGPKWFVHMDTNTDGDISQREFLGKSKMFRKLDLNHDGYIELKEANAVSTLK